MNIFDRYVNEVFRDIQNNCFSILQPHYSFFLNQHSRETDNRQKLIRVIGIVVCITGSDFTAE